MFIFIIIKYRDNVINNKKTKYTLKSNQSHLDTPVVVEGLVRNILVNNTPFTKNY